MVLLGQVVGGTIAAYALWRLFWQFLKGAPMRRWVAAHLAAVAVSMLIPFALLRSTGEDESARFLLPAAIAQCLVAFGTRGRTRPVQDEARRSPA